MGNPYIKYLSFFLLSLVCLCQYACVSVICVLGGVEEEEEEEEEHLVCLCECRLCFGSIMYRCLGGGGGSGMLVSVSFVFWFYSVSTQSRRRRRRL